MFLQFLLYSKATQSQLFPELRGGSPLPLHPLFSTHTAPFSYTPHPTPNSLYWL